MGILIPAGAAGAAAGFSAAAAGLGTAAIVKAVAINFVLAAAATAMAKSRSENKNAADTLTERQQLIRSSIANHELVYGRARKSGVLVFAESRNGYMYLVIVLASRQITAVDHIFFDDVEIGARDGSGNVTAGVYAGKARVEVALGAADATANAAFVAELPELWTSEHRLRGRACLYVRLLRDDDVYPAGIPTVSVELRGHAVYDPRDAGTRFTDNPALIARDWLLSTYGARVPSGELDDTAIGAAATACEERVTMASYLSPTVSVDTAANTLIFSQAERRIDTGDAVTVVAETGGTLPAPLLVGDVRYAVRLPGNRIQLATTYANALARTVIDLTTGGGGTLRVSHLDQARYTCNGVIDTGREWPAVLEDILSSMAGRYSDSMGQQRLYAGVYQTPTLSFDEDDLRAPIDFQTRLRRQDVVNTVRGVYIDPQRDWQPTDFAPVANIAYRTADGGEELEAQITWPMTVNEVRAQRLSKIVLEGARQGISGVLPLMLSSRAMKILPHETLMLTVQQLGWANKVFRVENWEFSSDGGIDVIIREESATVYDWAAGEATLRDAAPDTNLPNPFTIAAPSELLLDSGSSHLLIAGDGTILSRLWVGWTAAADDFVIEYEVQYKRAAESVYQSLPAVRGATSAYIVPVQDGESYDVRVRARNSIGVQSAWLSGSHVVVGKSAPPADVTGFVASFVAGGVVFTWNAVADADADLYEIRSGASYAAGTTVWKGRGQDAQIGYLAAGAYTWHSKAIDTSGNESASAANASLTVSTPSTVAVSGEIAVSTYRLSWSAASASFPVARYEIRHGASFAAGSFVAFADLTTYQGAVDWTGARTFWVAAMDAGGNQGSAGSAVLTVSAPAAPVIELTYASADAVLSWSAPSATLPLADYEVRYGSDWASGVSLGRVRTTRYNVRVTWTGSRTFWVAAYDSAGNVGSAGGAVVNPTAPSAPTIAPKVANNLVGLTWSEGAGSLPVERYELRRGATFAGANSLGYLTARTATLFELVGATYTYWVVGYDTAGNQGAYAGVSLLVDDPPGLTIYESIDSTFSGTLSSALIEFGDVVFPVNTTETWQQHFDNNAWATPQVQIDAGYEIYIEPASASGYYEEQIDHGSNIASGNVAVNATTTTLDGSPALTCTISYKQNVGDAWTDVSGFTAAFTNGRYFKVKVTCSSTGSDDLAALEVLQWVITS